MTRYNKLCYKDVTVSDPLWPSSILASVLYRLGLSPRPPLVWSKDAASIPSESSEEENDPKE